MGGGGFSKGGGRFDGGRRACSPSSYLGGESTFVMEDGGRYTPAQ